MDWLEQFNPNLDFPAAEDAPLKFAICSTPRSGSHLLGQLLYGTGRMGCPLEYFNQRNLVRWQERAQAAGADDLVRFLLSIRTSPNGCFGLKAHFSHLRTVSEYIAWGDFLTRFRHIHIARRDLLGQAISFARAKQTDVWISSAPGNRATDVYSSDLIRACLIDLVRQNACWEHLFSAYGCRHLVVEYEALASDPTRVVREVADFIGVNLPADAAIPGPRTSRQRDEQTESWRDRFVAEMRSEPSWAQLDVLQQASPPHRGATDKWKGWLQAWAGIRHRALHYPRRSAGRGK